MSQSAPEAVMQIKEHYILEKKLANQLREANKEERKKLYNTVYDELYSKVSYLLPQQREYSARQLPRTLRMLQRFLKPSITFLEIGPGNCLVSFAVAKRVNFVYAVDVSEEVTHNAHQPKNFKLVISDGSNIPVPNGTIDFAYSDQLMEHLHPEDALVQLQNIYQALKPGGMYLCITPSKLSGPHDISKNFDQTATGLHLKEYTVGELIATFKKVGFKKFKLLLGTKGYFYPTPCFPVLALEWCLNKLPRKINKKISRFLPIRLLLGIKLIAIK